MTPTETAEAVKDEFGFIVSRQLVNQYNPDCNQKLPQKWKKLFEKTRSEFTGSVAEIGISHQAYRLSELHEMAKRAKAMRNYQLAAQLLEQAAKERGGQYTNKQKIQITAIEEKKKKLAEILRLAPEALPSKKAS